MNTEDDIDAAFATLSETANRIADERNELLAAMRRIALPIECGCWPCVGQCRSKEALQIALDEKRDIAAKAIAKAGRQQ